MEFDFLLMTGFAVLGLVYVLMTAAKKASLSRVEKKTKKSAIQIDFEPFRQKTAEEPNNPKHWVHWGNALVASGRKAQNTNLRIHRYNEACSCYAQATDAAATYLPAWTAWGVALYELFRLQKSNDALLLEGGHNKFRSALELSPKGAGLWRQWGEELQKVAATVSGEHKRHILDLAQECFAKVDELTRPASEEIEITPERLLGDLGELIPPAEPEKEAGA